MTPNTQLGPYRVVAPLGAGGMGEVYRARDTRLGRDVAVKVLPKDFAADGDRLRRFEQEAKTLASLNHPNILTVFDVGQHEGRPYLVSELLEGQTLREALSQGGLATRMASDYSVQISQGLAAAHGKGVVHRDLKPENLVVTKEGRVKILDFGLAKLLAIPNSELRTPNSDDTDGLTLVQTAESTEPGRVMGTPSYMSPEQVRGELVDHRADIFAFGCVLYEMLSGQRPFGRETKIETMNAILTVEPPDLLMTKPDVPPALARVIHRCLEKQPERRFQSASDLAFALEGVSNAVPKNMPSDSSSRRKELQVSKCEIQYPKSEIEKSLITSAQNRSIAVLPFLNMSADPQNEYLSDGITEDLITALSQVRGLRVPARTSAFAFKGRNEDIREIGRQLNVRTILEGSVRKAGNRLRITAQLINVDDGFHLWSEKFDREMEDVFAVQDEISRIIAQKLEVQLADKTASPLIHLHTDNAAAYQLYLKGRYLWNMRTDHAVRKAIQQFQRAISKDPNYARAYAGLADSYNILGDYGYLQPKDAFPKAKAAAVKALEIDELLAEAHTALGKAAHLYDWNWAAAEEEFRRAIQLKPSYPSAHQWYAEFLVSPGRLDEAMRAMNHALELDPLSLIINTNVGWLFYLARQTDAAIAQLQKVLEMDPRFVGAHHKLGLAYAQKGNFQAALAQLKKALALSKGSSMFLLELGCLHARSGEHHEALKILDELKGARELKYFLPFGVAKIYAGLRQAEETFQWLQRAYEERSAHDFIYIKVDPAFEYLRGDVRFQDLLRKMALHS